MFRRRYPTTWRGFLRKAGVPTTWRGVLRQMERARRESARAGGQKVYFVEMVGHDLVKIGVSSDPEGRLRTLQTGNPNQLRLLAVFPGGRPLEEHLHRLFRPYHINLEWFHLADPIKAYIMDHGPPPRVKCRTRTGVRVTWALLPIVGLLTVGLGVIPLAVGMAVLRLYSHKARHKRLGTTCPIDEAAEERRQRIAAWDAARRLGISPDLYETFYRWTMFPNFRNLMDAAAEEGDEGVRKVWDDLQKAEEGHSIPCQDDLEPE